MSPETRTSERPYYMYTRNYIWIAYKDYRLLDGLRFLLPKLAMMSYFTLRSGHYRAFFSGLCHGLTGLKRVRPDRTPVRKTTLTYLAQLDAWRPGLLIRF